MNALRDLDPIYLFIAGCAIGAWALLRRSARRRRSGRRNVEYIEHLHRPASPWDGAQKDPAAMFDRQKVELCELAREVAGQIDSKLILLRQLMVQSDQQIERLEALLAELNDRDSAAAGASFARQ